MKNRMAAKAHNVLGTPLKCCCTSPMAGFYRNGRCATGPDDHGLHIICAEMTEEFLEFTKSRGNDLSTAAPEMGFPGLQPGDHAVAASRAVGAVRSEP